MIEVRSWGWPDIVQLKSLGGICVSATVALQGVIVDSDEPDIDDLVTALVNTPAGRQHLRQQSIRSRRLTN
jgi:hypothetical protein